MIKRRLKKWVAFSFMSIIVVGIIGIATVITNNVFSTLTEETNSYVLKGLASQILPVVAVKDKVIEKPFSSETVKTYINYYETTADKETQEKSLILYENTYMPNNGILYGCEEEFDILAIYDGVVSDIKEDDVFGNIIEIQHDNNLISKYASLSSVNVKVGDTVITGDVLGVSGKNKVVSETQNMLLLEIIYNGTNVNPTKYYNLEINKIGE